MLRQQQQQQQIRSALSVQRNTVLHRRQRPAHYRERDRETPCIIYADCMQLAINQSGFNAFHRM